MNVSQSFLKRMMISAINAREVESTRVSRLLHDEVGQVLSAVGLQLDVLKLDFQQQSPDIVARVNEIQKMLDTAVSQVRSLSYDLNPAVVERAGLQLALDRLVGRFRENFAGTIRFLYDAPERAPLMVANAWYKIAELALDNAVRHGQASLVELQVRARNTGIIMEVRDDGRGFSGAETGERTPGLGILLMEHYSTQAPITFELTSAPGKGTVVRSVYQPEQPAQSGTLTNAGPKKAGRTKSGQGNTGK
jgi:signal transduction histidine kinase